MIILEFPRIFFQIRETEFIIYAYNFSINLIAVQLNAQNVNKPLKLRQKHD